MSETSAAVHVPIDVELGGGFLANMLVAWIDGDRQSSFSVEAADEYRDQRATAEQDRLCVCAPVEEHVSTIHRRKTSSRDMTPGVRS